MTAAFENLPSRTHTDYSVQRSSFHDPGLRQVGGLGADTPCIFVRVHAPMEKEVITWEAKCEGGPAKIPSPFGAGCPWGLNANMVLLDFQHSVPIAMAIGGATPGHVSIVSGIAVYGRFVPEGIVRDYPSGKLPYESLPVGYNNFPSESFVQGVLDPATKYKPPLNTTGP